MMSKIDFYCSLKELKQPKPEPMIISEEPTESMDTLNTSDTSSISSIGSASNASFDSDQYAVSKS